MFSFLKAQMTVFFNNFCHKFIILISCTTSRVTGRLFEVKGAEMSVKTEEMDEEVMLGWAGAGDIILKK